MGTLYKAQCSNCGYEEEFPIGGGIRSIDLLGNIGTITFEEQEKIKKMYYNSEINSFSIENMLTKCTNCYDEKSIKLKTIITILDISQSSHIFGNLCSSCNSKLECYDEMHMKIKDKIACPKCGDSFLVFDKIGQWD